MNHLKLDVRVTLKTPFHTTGNRWVWRADKALAQAADGAYVIPATTLKGFLRSRAESILKSWDIPICTAPQPGTMCQELENLCLVCQIFGNPRQRTPLKFQDARTPSSEVSSQIRSGVGISRQRRAALPGHLFFIETAVAPSSEWLAIWEGYYPDRETAIKTTALLQLAAGLGHAIGSGGSRGLGWIEAWRIQATLDGVLLPEDDLRAYWQSWSKGAKK
jgi:CRISPR/Cas system CSM-associated protein Csm3 (group 7 of RAMP superfamily)